MQSAPQFHHWDVAGQYVEFQQKLRNLSFPILFFGCLAIVAVLLLPEFRASTPILLGLSGMALFGGIFMRIKPRYGVLVFASAVVIALGGWFIRVAVSIPSTTKTAGNIAQISIGLGIIMILSGSINLWKQRRYRSYPVTPPPEPMLDWLHSTIRSIKQDQQQAPDIIYFTDDQQPSEKSSIWHGRLDQEKITLVYQYGERFLFLDRSRFMIQLGPPATIKDIKGTVPLSLIRNGNQATITINTYRCQGLTNQLSYDRFVAWQQSGHSSLTRSTA